MQDSTPKSENSTLVFQSRDELAKFELAKVVYFESNSNYTKVFYPNGCTLSVIASLGFIENLLSNMDNVVAKKFLRVGRFLIINTDFLFRINILHQQLILTDGVSPQTFTLKASKSSLRSLKNLFKDRAICDAHSDEQAYMNDDPTGLSLSAE